MKKNIMAGFILIMVMTLLQLAAVNNCWAAPLEEGSFKVVGYYSGDLFDEPAEKLATDKLTHIIYAFLIPREDGSLMELEKPEQLRQLVSQAHRDGAEILIAVGGWSYKNQVLQPVFETVAASAGSRKQLVENICAFVSEYDLDGVELDWEHPHEGSIADYEKLVTELKTALDKQDKEFTAALNGAWSATEGPAVSMLMTDKCLDCFSFINVMAYDMNNEAHSPLWFADTSIDYWLNRGVPAEKIVVGMPLYARPSWMQYRHLVIQDPDFAYTDYASTVPLASHYNGLNTLREKTIIALSKAGGVMLFDVNEDSDDETSVVAMIDGMIKRTAHLTPAEMKGYVSVVLEERELTFGPEEGLGVPFIDENQRTMIPFRKPLEAISAVVGYEPETQTVTAEKDGIKVRVIIGQNILYVNDQPLTMDTRAIIKDGRTYIPLRQVFDAFGFAVEWHGSSRTAVIKQAV